MGQEDFDFNISRSPSSHEPNPETKPDWISLSLRYACLHWAIHIQSALAEPALDEAVNMIFRPKFLSSSRFSAFWARLAEHLDYWVSQASR